MKKINKKKKKIVLRIAVSKNRKSLKRRSIKKENLRKKQQEQLIKNRRFQKKLTCRSVKAPSNFSLKDNSEEVINYFLKNKNFTDRGYGVNFDLTKIENLTFDSVALVLATIYAPSFRKGGLAMGKPPERTELNKFFEATGFYNYVSSDIKIKEGEINGKAKRYSYTKKVSTKLAKQITIDITKHTFPGLYDGNRCKPLYQTLIECMANTENHAGIKDNTQYDWWAIYYMDPQTKITYVCFIDLGAGIIKSMQTKWRDWLTEKFDGLGIYNNSDKLLKVLDGKIEIPSRTGEKKRGKGLKQMNKFSKEQYVKNFIIISNDVYLNLNNNISKKLSNKFRGTFLYWELHPLND